MFEGLTGAECAERFPEVWARYQADRRCVPPGGEPQEQVVARLLAAAQDAATVAGAGQPVLLVGHGGSIRALLSAVFSRPFPPMANGCLFRIDLEGSRLDRVEDLGA